MLMKDEIREALRGAGLSGLAVCMHTSLRSFRPIEGGADTIIDAYLEEGCTTMVYTGSHGIHGRDLPPELAPLRNGTDPRYSREPHDRLFDPSSNDVDESYGILPRLVLGRKDRVRGNHPISSFTALGPLARRLVEKQAPLDVYAPLATLAKLDGCVVLMGVGLERMTLLHLAEKRAGRNLFLRGANGPDGSVLVAQTGSCSDGFGKFEPVLRSVRRELTVGSSPWQIFPARAALNLATHAIRRDTRITHCGENCVRCDDQVAGGPII